MVKRQEKEIKEAFNSVRGQDQGENSEGKANWRKFEFKGMKSQDLKKNAVKNEDLPVFFLEYQMYN